jgi:hypothetical protein
VVYKLADEILESATSLEWIDDLDLREVLGFLDDKQSPRRVLLAAYVLCVYRTLTAIHLGVVLCTKTKPNQRAAVFASAVQTFRESPSVIDTLLVILFSPTYIGDKVGVANAKAGVAADEIFEATYKQWHHDAVGYRHELEETLPSSAVPVDSLDYKDAAMKAAGAQLFLTIVEIKSPSKARAMGTQVAAKLIPGLETQLRTLVTDKANAWHVPFVMQEIEYESLSYPTEPFFEFYKSLESHIRLWKASGSWQKKDAGDLIAEVMGKFKVPWLRLFSLEGEGAGLQEALTTAFEIFARKVVNSWMGEFQRLANSKHKFECKETSKGQVRQSVSKLS